MPLDILGLVSIDTLEFFDRKSYVGGGGLATAWIASLWNVDTTLYSINSNKICNKIIESNVSTKQSYFRHVPLGSSTKTTHFNIFQGDSKDDYTYKITQLNSAFDELTSFLSKSEHEQYIKLPALNFYQLQNGNRSFSANPQGNFNLIEYCDTINTSGFIFLNKKELLNCSKMSLLCALEYIESVCQSFVITLGKDGSICYDSVEKMWWHCPSIFTNSYLSTLGCGDSFAGGFLAAYIKKLPISQCLAQGTISASCTMQSPSNMIVQWFDDTSLQHIVELYKYIEFFTSAIELHKYISDRKNSCINLSLSLDPNQKFCWIYM